VVDLGGPKEAQVQSYSHDGAIVHKINRIRQAAPMNQTTLYRELCKAGEPIDLPFGCGLGWAKRSTNSPHSPDGANVHAGTVRLRRKYSFVSNYFHHFLVLDQ